MVNLWRAISSCCIALRSLFTSHGPLYLTGVSMRLSHPTDKAKTAVRLMLFRLLRETCVWVWLAPLCLHRETSKSTDSDNIPSFDLALVVLKRACFFPFSELWNHWPISSIPGQTSSEALWEGTSELALQQNFTPFDYSMCLWRKAILKVRGSLRPSLYEKWLNTLQKMQKQTNQTVVITVGEEVGHKSEARDMVSRLHFDTVQISCNSRHTWFIY